MRLKYICESCGRTEIFEDPEEAFDEGGIILQKWEYLVKSALGLVDTVG